MSGFDWNNFASTLLATVVGAAVAALTAFWLSNRERPSPVWTGGSELHSNWYIDNKGLGIFSVKLSNGGDGAAYNVQVSVMGDASAHPVTSSKVDPGGSISATVQIPASGSAEYDPDTGKFDDNRAFDWPGGLYAMITWHQPPARLKQRALVIPLHNPLAGVTMPSEDSSGLGKSLGDRIRTALALVRAGIAGSSGSR